MGYGDESISEAPKLERTGAGTDPVRTAGPEEPRRMKLIGFGKLFGLQDIYEWDEVRIQGGADQARSSSSVEVTEKK